MNNFSDDNKITVEIRYKSNDNTFLDDTITNVFAVEFNEKFVGIESMETENIIVRIYNNDKIVRIKQILPKE